MRILAALILAAGSVVASCAPTPAPMEDAPEWECLTDGNGVCGPTNEGPAADEWRRCFVAWSMNPRGVTASEAAAECDEVAAQYGEVVRPR